MHRDTLMSASRHVLTDWWLAQAIEHLVAAKALVDDSNAPSASQLVDALHALTTVRAILADGLASGQRNDAPDAAIAMRQRWRLAELRAEEYAFVLLSRFLSILAEQVLHLSTRVFAAKRCSNADANCSAAQGGPGYLAEAQDSAWAKPLAAAVLGVRHMGLSGWQPAECMAVENELAKWQELGELTGELAAKRCPDGGPRSMSHHEMCRAVATQTSACAG